MKTRESLGDMVVVHALDPEDAPAIAGIRTATRQQKGVPCEDVFPYDDKKFAALALEWEATGRVQESSWSKVGHSMKEAAN